MKKIETLFKREGEGKNFRLLPEYADGMEWIHDAGVRATRKWDGTACLFRDGTMYKRYHHKVDNGAPPPGYLHWSFDPEQKSGHGWLPIGDGPDDRIHKRTFDETPNAFLEGQTYELCGPKINQNPEKFSEHVYVEHGKAEYPDVPKTFDGLRDWLNERDIEGLVFYHPDGRMAKIKKRDFRVKSR